MDKREDALDHIAHPLIFMRHGQTAWNVEGRFQGSTDTKLSPDGVIQAQENADLLKAFLRDEIITNPSFSIEKISLLCSPLRRAADTATVLREAVDGLSPPSHYTAFQELSLGHWEGLTSQEVKERYQPERRLRKKDRWGFAPEGGEAMAARSLKLKEALQSLAPYSVVVSHCGILRALLHLLDGQSREDAMVADIPHVGLMVWDGEKISMRNA